jgi:hypothetical protein
MKQGNKEQGHVQPSKKRKEETHNCKHPVRFQKRTQAAQEFKAEEFKRDGSAREDVVDDVVVRLRGLLDHPLGELYGVLDYRGVVLEIVKILEGKLVHHGVNLDDSGVDAVGNECRRGCTSTQTAVPKKKK